MTTTWNIIKLTCKTEGNMSNVVYRVHWECKVSGGTNTSVAQTGVCTLEQPDPNNFIQYNNLTKQEVVNWVKSTLGATDVNEVETRLTTILNDKLNTVTLDPPFAN